MSRRKGNIIFAVLVALMVAGLYLFAWYSAQHEKVEWKFDVKAMKAEAKFRATQTLKER